MAQTNYWEILKLPKSLSEMAARAGIEPFICFLKACAEALYYETAKTADAQLRAQKLTELSVVIEAWPKLTPELRAACRAVTTAAKTPTA